MDEATNFRVPDALRRLRKERDLGQKEVAAILGCARSTYAHYETGTREIPIDALLTLANAYDVPLESLVGLPVRTPEGSPAAKMRRLAEHMEAIRIEDITEAAGDLSTLTTILLEQIQAFMHSKQSAAELRQGLREAKGALLVLAERLGALAAEALPQETEPPRRHDAPP